MIYDQYCIEMEYLAFIQLLSKSKIQVKNIKNEDQIYFECSCFERKRLNQLLPDACLLQECFLLKLFKQIFCLRMVLSYFISILMFIYLSSYVYEFEIHGEQLLEHEMIKKHLVKTPVAKKSLVSLKEQLKQQLQGKVNWIEVVDDGCKYHIYFSSRKEVQTKETISKKLYAQEDAMIAYFDLVDGKKVVNVSDLVKKGDLLVDDQLVDHSNQSHQITSLGKVYGYTIKEITLEKKVKREPQSIVFFQMLLEARNEVSKDFLANDQICEENVLHFSKELGTIKMKVQYRLLKDISTKK